MIERPPSSSSNLFQKTWWLFFNTLVAAVQTGPGVATIDLTNDTVGVGVTSTYGNIDVPGVPTGASFSCIVPPSTQSTIVDIKVSPDNGATWPSIFPAAAPLTYPTTATGKILFPSSAFLGAAFTAAGLMRVDVLQSGGATGIQIVIEWSSTGGANPLIVPKYTVPPLGAGI